MTEPGQPSIATDQQQERSDQLPSTRSRKHLRYRLTASLVFLALVLIAALIIVSKQDNTHPTAARVIVQEATIIGPLIQHTVPQATILLKNTGSSPALKAKGRLVMAVWPSKTFPDWEMPLQLTNDVYDIGNIDPAAVASQTISLTTPLTDVQGMHLERKDWFIVILGVVAYTDGTNTPHKTSLCLIWRDTANEKMSPCERWNDQD